MSHPSLHQRQKSHSVFRTALHTKVKELDQEHAVTGIIFSSLKNHIFMAKETEAENQERIGVVWCVMALGSGVLI